MRTKSRKSGLPAFLDRVVVASLALAVHAADARLAGKTVEFAVPDPGGLTAIAAGPDGNVWFSDNTFGDDDKPTRSRLGRITPRGEITLFELGSAPGVFGIATGADGALWFTESYANAIGRMTVDGAVTHHPLPNGDSFPLGIVSGRDGALWFTEAKGNRIGRLTTSGALTEYPLPTPAAVPYLIAAAPDGSVWFAENGAALVGTISPGGALSETPVPNGGKRPYGIAVAPDGVVWVAVTDPGRLLRRGADGVLKEVPLAGLHFPRQVTTGPDGTLWFTELGDAGFCVARLAGDGSLAELRTPTNGSFPDGIAIGPDRNVWALEGGVGRIARISTGLGAFGGGSWVLPSSVLRRGAGGAEFHTSVRVLNEDDVPVTVHAALHDQTTGTTLMAPPVELAPRSQRAWDDALSSLFGLTLDEGAFGPIRFDADGPVVVSASVVNTRGCGGGARTGQWLEGVEAGQAVAVGELLQIAVSADGATGKRTNLVFTNAGGTAATATLTLRKGGDALATKTVWDPLESTCRHASLSIL